LIKGGHREGPAIDVLCTGDELIELYAERVATRHTHGVGCSLSAAIAARLAQGHGLGEACRLAKRWVTSALATAPGIGAGQGPIDHWAPLPE
jgi:hydroxymethylpyrimidine kinase/phosphomethylpyrimidine kinase